MEQLKIEHSMIQNEDISNDNDSNELKLERDAENIVKIFKRYDLDTTEVEYVRLAVKYPHYSLEEYNKLLGKKPNNNYFTQVINRPHVKSAISEIKMVRNSIEIAEGMNEMTLISIQELKPIMLNKETPNGDKIKIANIFIPRKSEIKHKEENADGEFDEYLPSYMVEEATK